MDYNYVMRSSFVKMTGCDAPTAGVGARHGHGGLPQRGGGYLNICTDFDVSEKNSLDPRLEDLVDMGISAFWRDLAQVIGFDTFVVVWSHLSMRADNTDEYNRVYVPRFDTFIRYQRNRLVVSLAAGGLRAREIQIKIKAELGQDISISHINRLIRQRRGE